MLYSVYSQCTGCTSEYCSEDGVTCCVADHEEDEIGVNGNYCWCEEGIESLDIGDFNDPAVYTMPENLRVAFIGDQGRGTNAQAVLELIKDEGADFVLHQGDFDYINEASNWDDLINSVLGPTFPYFASLGNHDLLVADNYISQLIDRYTKISDLACEGRIGMYQKCMYKGLAFVLSGVGTACPFESHYDYIEETLSSEEFSYSPWKVCSWHKNQRVMQLNTKQDQVTWPPYEICREAGAIIATGHEHSYSRTHLLSNMEEQTIVSTSSQLDLKPGESFVFVNGLAGIGIRTSDSVLAAMPHWASTYSGSDSATYGSLFCDFNINGDPLAGSCYFKNINGAIIDSFKLTTVAANPRSKDSPANPFPTVPVVITSIALIGILGFIGFYRQKSDGVGPMTAAGANDTKIPRSNTIDIDKTYANISAEEEEADNRALISPSAATTTTTTTTTPRKRSEPSPRKKRKNSTGTAKSKKAAEGVQISKSGEVIAPPKQGPSGDGSSSSYVSKSGSRTQARLERLKAEKSGSSSRSRSRSRSADKRKKSDSDFQL